MSKIEDDRAYRAALTEIVLAIAPSELNAWAGGLETKESKDDFSKEIVDLAESLLSEIGKRSAPR